MTRARKTSMASLGLKQVRRVVIFVVGTSVVLFGVALIVLPGPAVVAIPAGLAILALEFRWARHWLRRAKVVVKGAGGEMRRGKSPFRIWRDWRERRALRRARRTGNAAAAAPPARPADGSEPGDQRDPEASGRSGDDPGGNACNP